MAKVMQIGQKQFLRTCRRPSINRLSTTIAAESRDSTSRNAFEMAKPLKQIPGVKSWPVFGTSWIFLPLVGKYTIQEALQYDLDKYEKFGPISLDRFGNTDVVTITDPDDCECVFRNEEKYPSRTDFQSLRTYREMRKEWYSTLGVAILQGKEWYNLRFRLQKHMMKTKAIERFVKPMEEVAQDFTRHMIRTRDYKNEVPNFLDQLLKWSLESVAFVGLNTRLGCLEKIPSAEGMSLVKSVQDSFILMNVLESLAGNIPWWKWFSTPKWREFVRTMDFFSEIAFKYANRTLEDVQEKVRSGREDEMTMVMAMLATKDLDVSGVGTMIVDMMMAGVDTTSHSISYFLYALAKAPEKQEKLYQEIMKVLPNPSDGITPEVLRHMNYLKNCIKESQRLYPIARAVMRIAGQDMVLSGYQVPRGTTIMCSYPVIQKQEKYFKNSKEFIPERWMSENDKPHPFSFLPFGFGIRGCIGRRLAELEMQCLAIEIIRRFKVEYYYEDFKMITRVVNLADRPLQFAFLDRKAEK